MNIRNSKWLTFVSRVLLSVGLLAFVGGVAVAVSAVATGGTRGLILAVPVLVWTLLTFASCSFLPLCGLCLADMHARQCELAAVDRGHQKVEAASATRRSNENDDTLLDMPEWEAELRRLNPQPVLDEIPANWPSS